MNLTGKLIQIEINRVVSTDLWMIKTKGSDIFREICINERKYCYKFKKSDFFSKTLSLHFLTFKFDFREHFRQNV